MARIQPVLTATELALVDQMAERDLQFPEI
jgi:hypothetical protein